MSDSIVVNLATLCGRHAAEQPDRIALREGGDYVSWARLDAAVDELASALRRLALPQSQGHAARVAIGLPNNLHFVVSLLAVIRAGLVAVPLNPGFAAREIKHVLADSGASLLIGTESVLRAVAERGSPADPDPIAVIGDSGLVESLARHAAVRQPASQPSEELALLLYTSGTEGAPKGAMLTHSALLANHAQLAAIEPPIMSEDDVVLLALPMFHAYGLNTGLGTVLWYGACGVLVAEQDPRSSAEAVAATHASVLVGVPQMFLAWGSLPDAGELLRSVRLAVCGAAAMDPEVAAHFTEATGRTIHIGYGLTETSPVLAATLLSPRVKPGSIGRPIPGVMLRLVNSEGRDVWHAGRAADAEADESDQPDVGDYELDLADSPGSDPGQIVVRGDNLFLGYWPDRRGGPGADGWWQTRDVAYADGEGDLFLVDRLGELIIVSGFNVYPAEVEQVLMSHPGVAEAAAVGDPHPVTGQAVRAVVVRSADNTVTEDELAAYCARNLARFKCPTTFEFVDELPHSATGKVRKTLLRKDGRP